MEKEKKDKIKKKKTCQKDSGAGEFMEKKAEVKIEFATTSPKLTCEKSQEKATKKEEGREDLFSSNEGLGSKKKVSPEGFYIAHPKNVKRTAHFKDVHSRKLAELLDAFQMFDFDRDGVIDRDDLKKTFTSLCIEADCEEIDEMLSQALSPVNFDAFVILLGYKTLDLDPEEVVVDALSNWDDHQEGLVSYERLKRHLMAWGDKFTEEEATEALTDAPAIINKAKEKMIDYVQFSEDLCGLRKIMQRKPDQ